MARAMTAHGWDEHVGELKLWIAAPTERDVFLEAARAVREVLAGEAAADGTAAEERPIALEGSDRGVLLAEWVGELAFLAETEAFLPDDVAALELGADGLRASVRGHAGRAPHLIKAATLHDLRFEPVPEGWRAQVVLDV
jgi:SHS2 domain-containing protein